MYIRSALAVLAGFVGMSVIVMIGTFAAARAFFPAGLAAMRTRQAPTMAAPREYLIANLVLSFAAAVAGGWIAARLAPGASRGHADALAVLVLLMSAPAIIRGKAQPGQPAWYPQVIAAIGVAGVVIGGIVYQA
jgi:hypothetical protein